MKLALFFSNVYSENGNCGEFCGIRGVGGVFLKSKGNSDENRMIIRFYHLKTSSTTSLNLKGLSITLYCNKAS